MYSTHEVTPSGAKRARRFALVIAAMLLPGMLAPGEGRAQTSPAKPAAPAQQPQPWGGGASQGIPVAHPLVQTVSEYVELTGNAASVNVVKLFARVEGYLEAILFADGARVRSGTKLFTVQQDQYKAQLQQAQAQVRLQQAALLHAKTEVVRYTALVKKDAATQIEVDNWVYQQAAAEANLSSAQAQVTLAQLNLSYTDIKAPFDGLMGRHLVDPFNVVGGPGQPAVLAEITQLDPIYAVANLNETDLKNIRDRLDNVRLSLASMTKIPVEVGLSNGTGYPYRGHLEYVAPGIDTTTGTLMLRGIFDNHKLDMLPGMFLRIRIPMPKAIAGAVLVPDIALGSDQIGRFVLVVNKDDVVERRSVQTGEVLDGLRIIRSGLSQEDRVIVGELYKAPVGAKIAPQLTVIPPIEGSSPDAGQKAAPRP